MSDQAEPKFPVTLWQLFALAIPAMGANLLQHLYRPIDQYFVQDLGSDAQGALGAASFIVIFMYGAIYLISGGVGAHVARATGAGDTQWRQKVVGQSLTAGVSVGVVLAVLGYFFAESAPYFVGLSGNMGDLCSDYLFALALTGMPLVLAPTMDSACNAMGNPRLPLALHSVAILLNVCLTPLLIHSGYGVSGAALGSTIAQSITVSVGLFWLFTRLKLNSSHFIPTRVLLDVMNTGLPVGASIALFAFSYQMMLKIAVEPLGPEVFAALAIGFAALESITWPIFVGYNVAVGTLVGQALGAGRVDQAKRAVRLTLIPSLVTGVTAGLIFYFGAGTLVDFFAADDDEQVILYAISYAQVLCWSQPFVALEAAFEGVLMGAGATRALLLVTMPTNLLRIPVGWYLASEFGAVGVWWAINLTSMLKTICKSAVVYHGGWTKIKLRNDDE